jgi:hypothetical protein
MRVPYRVARAALASAALWSATATATATAEEAHGDAAAHGAHEPHHTLGIFIGNSTEDRREEARAGATLGIEYEYRFAPEYGVGLVLEHVAGDLDVNVLAVPFAYHRGPWKFYAAPGFEGGHGRTEALLRVGVEYGFHVGGFEISPQVDLDFVSGERVFVIGLVFARSL